MSSRFAATSRADGLRGQLGRVGVRRGQEHRAGRLIGLLGAEGERQRGRGDPEGAVTITRYRRRSRTRTLATRIGSGASSGASSRASDSTHTGALSCAVSKLGKGSSVAR